jgi:urease accessory protein
MPRAGMASRMDTVAMTTSADQGLYRLMSWLSPSFPVGAYSYSHGIEYAFEAGDVTDPASLQTWIEGILDFGSGRQDGVLLRCAWEAVRTNDEALLEWAIVTAATRRASREMALETSAQGTAFVETLQNSWCLDGLEQFAALLEQLDRPASYPVAVGVAARLSDIPLETTLAAYLHAFISNLVSAGVRMIPLGQTAGQQITHALEPAVASIAASLSRDPLDPLRESLGSAAVMVDWSSMQHETQYTRIFRS